MHNSHRFLVIYSGVLTVVFVVTLVSGFAASGKETKFDEIEVQRINIVEPNGTLRMVISNKAKLPGVIIRGKEEHQEDRPYAGMLFYNNEGSENGGLVFGGHKNAKGEVTESGGSLSFDKYDAGQIVQLAGVDDHEDRFSGLAVNEGATGGTGPRRIWVGRDQSGVAELALMDGAGKKRILLQAPERGAPRIAFLDSAGKVVKEWLAAKQ